MVKKISAWTLVALSLLALPATLRAATLTGTVSWTASPKRRPVAISRDRHVCLGAEPLFEPFVTVDPSGRVLGAAVWVDDLAPEPNLPESTVTIDQVGCVFVPSAAVSHVGATLRVVTSDPVLHTVHVKDEADRTVANWAMPVRGQEVSLRLERSGVLRLRCEAGHDWMRAAVRVLDHRAYAVTDVAGHFAPDVASRCWLDAGTQ